jgi:hypothetical protein
MELKRNEHFIKLHSEDMGKCVLLTSLSALDLREIAGVAIDIVIPFVLGDEKTAFLFVTRLPPGSSAPQVMEVQTYLVTIQAQRVAFFATLAVLVKKNIESFSIG